MSGERTRNKIKKKTHFAIQHVYADILKIADSIRKYVFFTNKSVFEAINITCIQYFFIFEGLFKKCIHRAS